MKPIKAGSHSGCLAGWLNVQARLGGSISVGMLIFKIVKCGVWRNLIFSKTAVTLSKSLSVVLVFLLEFHVPFDTKCAPSQAVKLRNETGGSSSLEESLHCRLNIGNITAVLL